MLVLILRILQRCAQRLQIARLGRASIVSVYGQQNRNVYVASLRAHGVHVAVLCCISFKIQTQMNVVCSADVDSTPREASTRRSVLAGSTDGKLGPGRSSFAVSDKQHS